MIFFICVSYFLHVLKFALAWKSEFSDLFAENRSSYLLWFLNASCLLFYRPDQQAELLTDYVTQLGVGRAIPLHTVAYDCSNALTNVSKGFHISNLFL